MKIGYNAVNHIKKPLKINNKTIEEKIKEIPRNYFFISLINI